jgi:hypothetical protein
MGDPRGCAGHINRILKADGTWMIVEPIAGNRPEDNMYPVGRLYYNASTMICVPTSLDQEVGEAWVRRRVRQSSPRSFETAGLLGFERRPRGRSTWCLRHAPKKTATAHLSNFAALLRSGNVRYWHKADMAITLRDVRFRG